MAWELLPVDYTDAVWAGLKRYNQINNEDGSVSFQDITSYTGKEKSFFGAKDANRMNEALNTIMSMVENGTDLYTAFQNYFAEKAELEIEKEECQSEQKHLKVIAILLIVLFAAIIVLCALMRVLMEKDTSLIMMAVSFVIVLLGTYVFLRYQKCQKEIERCMLNKNHAILLENRVTIKYVNIKNAVDYSCQKYHVKNSRDLTYVYEQYQAAVIEREKFQRTSEDLEYNSEKMLSILKKHNLYDAKVWLNYANAIVNEKDMVELKHNLIVRRQKLRNRMEYNIGVITQLRATILLHRSELGDKAGEVSRLLNKIAQLTLEFEDED